ncbi:MAG TPA: tetratricopeptide repeat protein [Gaiellaceae bacterium]|jgi:tetratricopeptide (TPR) repeat protein
MKTIRISDIEPIPIVNGELQWRPVRRTLGIEAFGINAYTANAGELVVEEHDETGAGAGHHEELYLVVTGRATFTVDGKSIDAPVGTLVFLGDPKERRGARAVEDGTTVLAIGGVRGEAFRISPWEFAFAGTPAYKAKRYAEAEALLREGLELYPDNPSLLYDLACLEALQGRSDDALDHLRIALEAQPKYAGHAATDPDLESIRDDPRFSAAVESQPE